MDGINKDIEAFVRARKNKVDVSYAITHRILWEMVFDEPEKWLMKFETNGSHAVFNLFNNTISAFKDDYLLEENDFQMDKVDESGVRLYIFHLPKPMKFGDCDKIIFAFDSELRRFFYFILEMDVKGELHLLSHVENFRDLGVITNNTDLPKTIFDYLLE